MTLTLKHFGIHPKKYGRCVNQCRICNNRKGVIRKYQLKMCRQCFKEQAVKMGWRKVRSHVFPLPCSTKIRSVLLKSDPRGWIQSWCIGVYLLELL